MTQIAQSKNRAAEASADSTPDSNKSIDRRLNEGVGRIAGAIEQGIVSGVSAAKSGSGASAEISLNNRKEQAQSLMTTAFQANAALRAETLSATGSALRNVSSLLPAQSNALGQAAEAVASMGPRLAPLAGIASKVGAFGAVAVGVIEFVSCKDKIEGFCRGLGVAGGAIGGAQVGVQIGIALGALGGPAAPITVPVCAVLGTIAGAGIGQWAGRGLGAKVSEIVTGHKSELSEAEKKKK